MEQDTTDS